MAFMEREITGKIWWFKVETSDGTEYVPGDVVSSRVKGLKERIRPYVQAKDIYSVTVVQGYGARLSAPGYMDCTEWVVCDSEEEAEEYLRDTYGDDEEDSEEEE